MNGSSCTASFKSQMCKYMFIENGANFEVFQPKINIQWPNIRIENKTTTTKTASKTLCWNWNNDDV